MYNGLIICAGMRRAGSTWQYDIARDLVLANGGDCWGFVIHQNLARLVTGWAGKPTVIKSHVYFPKHTPAINYILGSGSARVITSYRDLRQIAASLIRMKIIPKNDNRRMIDELAVILSEGLAWQAVPGALIQSYENITTRPHQCVREIATILDIPLCSRQVKDLVSRYNKRAQVKRQPKVGYDGDTCLHRDHVTTKKYDDINPELKIMIEARFGYQLIAWGYP